MNPDVSLWPVPLAWLQVRKFEARLYQWATGAPNRGSHDSYNPMNPVLAPLAP